MKKIEVYKTSDGQLFEDEKEYVYAEAVCIRATIKKQIARLTRSVEQDYINYYNFINVIGTTLINTNTDLEKLKDQYNKSIDIFMRESQFKNDDLLKGGILDDGVDYEPYIWGNDILCGFDVNR